MVLGMNKDVDAYTQHVMSRIEPDVFKTLNIIQLQAIQTAISTNSPFRQHALDIRGTLPLYFSKLYFVILMGRDRRTATRLKESVRRKTMRGVSLIMFLYIILAAGTPLILILLYGLKVLAGIDVFPDFHLSSLFNE